MQLELVIVPMVAESYPPGHPIAAFNFLDEIIGNDWITIISQMNSQGTSSTAIETNHIGRDSCIINHIVIINLLHELTYLIASCIGAAKIELSCAGHAASGSSEPAPARG
jgi:hypothetical protein